MLCEGFFLGSGIDFGVIFFNAGFCHCEYLLCIDLGANIFAGIPGWQIPLAILSTGSTIILEKK